VLYEVNEGGSCTRIRILGPVDFDSVEPFRRLLERYVAQGKSILLDLESCSFLCSMAVGLVLGFAIQARQNGGDLRITKACDRIRELLEEVRGADLILSGSPDECKQ